MQRGYLAKGFRDCLQRCSNWSQKGLCDGTADSETNRHLSCAVTPDSGANHAAVCKPDSEKRVIAIYSKFCESPFAQLWGICKVKTIIHECTHFTDTFNSQDHMYLDSEAGAMIFARNKPHQAISNADSIAGYIATFDGVNIAP
ncbi:M35 family metallo-endopeptidase [Paraburkholderia sp. 35.1]|uniref:M35 family metallo-endopeptidase n=1 Tax=Paraburkholderia sp. 35.1 TaxID=2991058 RepID=UPI003D1F376D